MFSLVHQTVPRQPQQLGGAAGGVVGDRPRGRGEALAQDVALRRQAEGLLPGGHLRTGLLTLQGRRRTGKLSHYIMYRVVSLLVGHNCSYPLPKQDGRIINAKN